MNVSSEIAWGIIRDNSCFLLKKRGVKKPFSTEPCNLTNRNAMRYNGLVNAKAVGVSAAADNKGFTVTTKRGKLSHKPSKATLTLALDWVRRLEWELVVGRDAGRQTKSGELATCCPHRS